MAEKAADFIELSEYWISITRKDYPSQGLGKWSLFTRQPQQLYQNLRELMISGALLDACSLKTKSEPDREVARVYLYSGPYTDQEKLLRLAQEIRDLDQSHDFQLERPLIFTTDLHNTWKETLSRPGDGYHELIKKINWIYKYQGGELIVQPAIQALHQALENPLPQADPEFLLIRSLLPENMFAGE
jgi:hypothetical protein